MVWRCVPSQNFRHHIDDLPKCNLTVFIQIPPGPLTERSLTQKPVELNTSRPLVKHPKFPETLGCCIPPERRPVHVKVEVQTVRRFELAVHSQGSGRRMIENCRLVFGFRVFFIVADDMKSEVPPFPENWRKIHRLFESAADHQSCCNDKACFQV